MKIILASLCFILTHSIMAKEINLTGLKAKAVFDTLNISELEIFADGAMGKIYFSTGEIKCVKSTEEGKEGMNCKFEGNSPEIKPVLLNSEDNTSLSAIRFVLNEATGAEKITGKNSKTLKIKSLDCKHSGFGHVLDDRDIELKYECKITL